MAQLAIKGHSTRGKEVIEILEMFGGKNNIEYDGSHTRSFYFINNIIIYSSYGSGKLLGIDCYTLEEFLEKFPYKVGDKVQHKGATSCGSVFEVEKMRWEENTVKYTLRLFGCNYKTCTLPAEYLQPYKEETMEEIKIDIPKGYEFAGVDDDNKQVVFTKIQPQYPKTYEECCEIMGIEYPVVGGKPDGLSASTYRITEIRPFIYLLICRDAYWKIAGDWRPEFRFGKKKYCIMTKDNKVISATVEETNRILVFPTEKMRDAFYENFKDLIEQCKELL